ncbi:hypothetical protein MKC54_21165, partial [[Clostridium] innocuum]|nr:hypothetical protein [[Clostridium] innocuum]MCR0579410.1 hypothetical protein [[Clostridium] innocuum]
MHDMRIVGNHGNRQRLINSMCSIKNHSYGNYLFLLSFSFAELSCVHKKSPGLCFVDKNGKNTSRVHKRLGTLAELSLLLSTDRDGVMAWAKEQAR